MSMTIYLDVDGVLNAVTRHIPTVTGWGEYRRKKVNSYQIMYAPALVEAINKLSDRDDVTFKWLTTWEEDAARDLSPALGINGQNWQVLTGDQHSFRGSDWWKLEAIQRDVAATKPEQFVWIDDDFKDERHAIEWMLDQTNGYPISPSMRDGLTRAHMEEIEALVEGLAGAV